MEIFSRTFPVEEYDLGATLNSGQAFRWNRCGTAWEGVIGHRWVRLEPCGDTLVAQTVSPPGDWMWLTRYLQLEVNLRTVLATFPEDPPLRAAVMECRGLRLLRQEPWECLASFILSSTKQIVQIRQIIDLVCRRFGTAVAVPPGRKAAHGFPSATILADVSESELRACKMGFRATYLRAAAEAVARGHVHLTGVGAMPIEDARKTLMSLLGVGRKIADCVLLFGYGFPTAFPVDVWILRALRELYFRKRRTTPKQLLRFSETYFGEQGGYAQQYLFHYVRRQAGRVPELRSEEEWQTR